MTPVNGVEVHDDRGRVVVARRMNAARCEREDVLTGHVGSSPMNPMLPGLAVLPEDGDHRLYARAPRLGAGEPVSEVPRSFCCN
jgi:hypothetical protein